MKIYISRAPAWRWNSNEKKKNAMNYIKQLEFGKTRENVN